jgi:hypothetical protein
VTESELGARCLDAVRDLFGRYPEGLFELVDRKGAIDLKPIGPDTFPVTVYDEGDGAMIAAGRWHTHYEEPMQLAFCALWLLTPFYRLVEELKGGVLVATWVERYEAEGWVGADPVYFLNPEDEESWQRVGEETFARRYTQQDVLPAPRPYREFVPEAALDDRGYPVDFVPGRRVEVVPEPLGPTLF